jgi:hypothetical protein
MGETRRPRPVESHSAEPLKIAAMEVVDLDTQHVRTAAFAARLRLLRIGYRSGLVREYLDIPPALFAALVRSGDPEAFLRERVAGRYEAHDIRAA